MTLRGEETKKSVRNAFGEELEEVAIPLHNPYVQRQLAARQIPDPEANEFSSIRIAIILNALDCRREQCHGLVARTRLVVHLSGFKQFLPTFGNTLRGCQ